MQEVQQGELRAQAMREDVQAGVLLLLCDLKHSLHWINDLIKRHRHHKILLETMISKQQMYDDTELSLTHLAQFANSAFQ